MVLSVKSKLKRKFDIKSLFAFCGIFTVSVWILSMMSGAGSKDQNLFAENKSVTIWAWDRFDDLSFLKGDTDVTYYAGTFYLRDNRAIFNPRKKELICPESAKTSPSFRIEAVHSIDSEYKQSAIATICDTIKIYLKSHKHSLDMVQIDFDAGQSQRSFYKDLLKELRTTLGAETKISITALTSWCLSDRWMQGLDVDEIVIMLFSLGKDKDETLALLELDQLDTGNDAHTAIGISANEPSTNQKLKELGILDEAQKIYIFQSLPWTKNRYLSITNEVVPQ